MGFLLFIIATILLIPITLINLIFVLIKNIRAKGFFKVVDGYFKQAAVDIDRFGNSNFRTLLNSTMRKKNGYEFGKIWETISSVLGKNQRDNTLSFTGKCLANILDFLDKDHCKKSIKDKCE